MPQYSRLELRKLEVVEEEAGDSSSNAGYGGEHCWVPLGAGQFQVRAASYLKDGRKMPSAQASLLLAVELFRSPAAAYHVAKRADSPAHTLALRTSAAVDYVFVVNMILPAVEGVYQVVFYHAMLKERVRERVGCGGFGGVSGGSADSSACGLGDGCDDESGASIPSAPKRLLERFVNGTDAFRNKRFKLLPNIVEGPWLVQQAVGSRPALLGKTLRQRFHRGEGYMEVGVDCNSSPAAGRIVSLVKSYAKQLVVDLAFVIEAQTSEELPECVLGCGRMVRISLDEDVLPKWPYEHLSQDEDEEHETV